MATTSYPRVGTNGWNASEWSKRFDSGDGLSDNTAGTSCALTRIDASNVARISPGRIDIQGYTLEVTADEDLSVPTAAGTYDICGMYDPTLNVAQGDGSAAPAGPCRLIISTSPPSTAGGKVYTILYRITRAAGQALSQATLTRFAQHVGVVYRMSVFPAQAKTNPETVIVGFDHPVGTSIYEQSTGLTWHKLINADANGNTLGTYWQSDLEGPTAFAATSGLASRYAAPSRAEYVRISGCLVKMQGTLQRSAGTPLSTTNVDVALGTLPAGFRPQFTQRFMCKTGPGDQSAEVRAEPSGALIMNGPGQIDWVDLSALTIFVIPS